MERWFGRFLYRIITVVAVLLGLAFIFFTSAFSIQNIEVVRDNFNIDNAKVENVLRDYMGKSILLTRRDGMAERIVGNFPEFKTVIIKKILPDRIRIFLEAHPAVANLKAYYVKEKGPQPSPYQFSELNRAIQELARTEEKPQPLRAIENGGGKTTITNASDAGVASVIETQNPASLPADNTPVEQKGLINAIGQAIFDQEENLELRTIVIRDLGREILDREQIIPAPHIEYILESVDYFEKTMNLKITDIIYFPVGREIHLKTKNKIEIWLFLEQPFVDQIDKLKVIYERAELNKLDLAYIDLRVKEKVIYCPRQSSCRNMADK